jgi:hypothetical protein
VLQGGETAIALNYEAVCAYKEGARFDKRAPVFAAV